MPYNSTITFTLDTICPWTYLAKKRLSKALAEYHSSHPESNETVTFSLHYAPYQLYPEASKSGEGKYEWYKTSRYGDSEEKMRAYTTIMKAYGRAEGIDFKFGGTMANTLDAHRLIMHFQESKGPETADRIVDSLYRQYFEEERHPSDAETLLRAATDAGLDEGEAKAFIEDDSEGLMDVKMAIREQAGNGIDAVPYIVIEGKRRDVTLQGAREVHEYVKALETIAKEAS